VTLSHHQFRHPTKPGTMTVKHPAKDLLIKTLYSALKQAVLTQVRGGASAN